MPPQETEQVAEKPKTRTLPQIQQEYFQMATQAGDLSYRIACETEDLNDCFAKMKLLNQEGAKLQAEAVLARNAVPKATEEKPVEAPASELSH